MSLTHRDLAALVAALYDAPDSVPWLYLSNPDANVFMGIIRKDDYLLTGCRGSYDIEDWFHDFLARPVDPIGRPEFKGVHAGFYSGTPEAWDIINFYRKPTDKLVFKGHSLGAARSILLAGQAIAHGIVPHFVCCWGEPAPFYPVGNMILVGVPGVSYRNAVSIFTDPIPESTRIAGYEHNWPLTDVHAKPTTNMWTPRDLHSFTLYHSVTPATEIP